MFDILLKKIDQNINYLVYIYIFYSSFLFGPYNFIFNQSLYIFYKSKSNFDISLNYWVISVVVPLFFLVNCISKVSYYKSIFVPHDLTPSKSSTKYADIILTSIFLGV